MSKTMKFIELNSKEKDFLHRWLSPKVANKVTDVIDFIGRIIVVGTLIALVASMLIAWVATLIKWIF